MSNTSHPSVNPVPQGIAAAAQTVPPVTRPVSTGSGGPGASIAVPGKKGK
jgi:hypothetical protein